jgi:cytochrome c-type biogenesis protein CcmH
VLLLVLALMLAAAAALIVTPLYRHDKRMSVSIVSVLVVLAGISPALYFQIGSPKAESSLGVIPNVDEMVSSLAARLEERPDDLAGWKMLGRSYLELRRLPESIAAYEKAVELESGNNGQTLADLGEAILLNDESSITGRAGQLFETALSLTPANPKALFYGGLTAINRGEPELGADRWEALLATSPPDNVQDILRQRIAILRGETPASETADAETGNTVITVNVELSTAASAAVRGDETVFVIARDPAQPSPPIAAVRRRASEIPSAVTLSDADAMIPGRVPSAFAELEIIARISASGQPIAQSGDWFGRQKVTQNLQEEVRVIIDQQVP